MAEVGRSPRRFLERRGLVPTARLPHGRFSTGNPQVRDYDSAKYVAETLPWPHHREVVQGDPVPDRGASGEWPHPPVEVSGGE
jgi:hypothetical protein